MVGLNDPERPRYVVATVVDPWPPLTLEDRPVKLGVKSGAFSMSLEFDVCLHL